MKNLQKYVKGLAYILALLMLFQSCVAYQKQSYSPKKAAEFDDMQIKIKTINGNDYKLSWIDEEDGNIVSMKNVKRDILNKDEIEEIIVNNPFRSIPIEEAVNHQGNIFIKIKDGKKENQKEFNMYDYEFIDVKDDGEYLKTYTMTGPDTTSIIIPISKIEKVRVEDKLKSSVRTVGLAIGGTILLITTIGMISMVSNPILSFSN